LRTKNSKNLRIARWALEVQDANITVKYRKRTLHGNADCLSRLLPIAKPCTGYDSSLNNMKLSKSKTVPMSQYDFKKEIFNEYKNDSFYASLLNEMADKKNTKRYKMMNGLIYYMCPISNKDKLCIPESLSKEIFFQFHDSILSGHVGIRKCYSRIKHTQYGKFRRKNGKTINFQSF